LPQQVRLSLHQSPPLILPDNETKVDLLNNEAIAATIIKLLRKRPDHPVTIGVHGDWGAGKSSVLEMIESGLAEDDKVLCLKFNGWRFQGFEDAKIALIEGIATGLIEKRPMLVKAGKQVEELFKRIDWLKVAKKAGGLAFTAFTGIPTPTQIEAIVGVLQGMIADPIQLATKDNIKGVLEGVEGLLKPKEGESTNVSKEINAFRKAFDELLKSAGIEQLIVLVDDLDRCLPDTAIETLEAIRLFVFTSRTAFVVAADEAMIEYAVRKHFPDLPNSTGSQSYARNYLEKLIQVPFRIPALGDTETRIYITLLLVGAELGENDPAFTALIATARERLKKPWENSTLDAASVKRALGEKFYQVQASLNLSDQIGPVLASGTNGNPRQIKRFLNTLILRKNTAEARGFGNEVKLPVLAKLMLAERLFPTFFDQIATLAAGNSHGRCLELTELESDGEDHTTQEEIASGIETPEGIVPTNRERKTRAKPEVVKKPDGGVLSEWLSTSWIKSWAGVQPAIGVEDLRPYLFVAKDRKDYLGKASVLGHLATVAEKLFGTKLAVQALESDLKLLAPPEAAQVFELVRSRIMGSGSFNTQPAGIDGIAVLVKAHTILQGSLIDFLEGLPLTQIGTWVCSGWGGALKDPDISKRFEQLLEVWSKDGGEMLKSVASNVLRTKRQVSG
jgi:hypothetical protein